MRASVSLTTPTAGVLATSVADVRQAQATVDETAAAFTRAKALSDKQLASEGTTESAKAAADRATATLASANANLKIAQANADIAKSNLEKASITSPIDGVVLSRAVEVGQITRVGIGRHHQVAAVIRIQVQQHEDAFGAAQDQVGPIVVGGWRSAQETLGRRVVGGAFDKGTAPGRPQTLHVSRQPDSCQLSAVARIREIFPRSSRYLC